MANFPGWLTEGGIAGDSARISGNLDDLVLADIFPPSQSEQATPGAGAALDQLPVSQLALPYAGDRTYTFFFDWYFRVHVVPSKIALGALVSFAVQQVEVWSARFVANTLQSIDEVGTEGLTLTGPEDPPTDFLPLDSRFYSLRVELTGPAAVDAVYTFNFDLDTPTLEVTGARVLPFAFPPDWDREVLERLEWLTDVQVAYSAKERRAQLRNGPRLALEYGILLGDDTSRVRLENTLHGWQSRIFGVPLWHQWESLSAPLPAGSTSVATQTDAQGYRVGGLAVLVDGLFAELHEVLSVGAGVVTFTTPTLRVFPKGSGIMPARLARLPRSVSLDYPTDAFAVAGLRFEGLEEEDITPTAESADYRGYPVFLTRRDWNQDVAAVLPRFTVVVDFGTGRTRVDDRAEFSNVRRQHGFVFEDRQAVEDFRGWLAARSGRRLPLWLPSGHRDLLVTQTIAASATSITVENRGHALVAGQLGRRDIMLELSDGTRFYRRVTDVVVDSEAEETVNLDADLGQNVEPTDIRRASYMALARLAADAVEVAHVTDQISRVQLAFEALRDDTP